jgi:hypothetical protein
MRAVMANSLAQGTITSLWARVAWQRLTNILVSIASLVASDRSSVHIQILD